MKIAILFDGASALGASPDVLILETVEEIERILAREGHQIVRIPVNPDARWVERVRRGKFDLAFNLCEGIDGVGAFEPAVIAVLELFGVPYTGSSSYTTAICLHKHVLNGLMETRRLPVPRWGVVRPGDALPTVGFPAICKPAAEDASIGVEQRSVVRSIRALAERVAAMHERWPEVLVQRYIPGREINVGIVGDTVLPIAEIDFGDLPRGMWRIVTYRSKWETGSEEDLGARPTCPAALEPELSAEIERIALDAWRAVGGGGEGYGRVDLRVDRAGRPWILEVNANPDIAPDAGLARMARVAGLEYDALILTVCELARARARGGLATDDQWTRSLRLSGVALPGLHEALDLFAVGQR